jgi:pyruvate dehydrogenase E1 component alpha subunit
MDVAAVHEAAETALAHCRAGNGPYLMEMKTYRYRGHSMSDPAKYRTREEVQSMREHHDPIASARAALLASGADEADLKRIEDDIKGIVNEAAAFAQSSPEPDPSELWTDVLVEA